MPAPSTTSELIALIRRSGLVEDPQLDGFLADAHPDLTPGELLAGLIGDGTLTPFQADQLAQGRFRGFELGGYRLLDRIGTGGTSQVYLAEHVETGARAAVKVLAARLADDPVARERFVREANAAIALTHPNIVHVIAVDPDATFPFLVMEYIDGVSLQAAVARHGTFAAGTAAYCGRQVALGLQRAHEVGLVHRDIKPANLLVDRQGLVKVLDLGIVRHTEADDDLTRRMRQGERLILGTAEYLAPEQALNCSAVDTRADLYALGSTLYFLLAGHPPFPGGHPLEMVTRKLTVDPTPIDRLRPDVPAGLAGVIHKLLARDPADRFRTPVEAAIALTPFAHPAPGFPQRLFLDRATVVDEAGTPTEIPGVAVPRTAVVGSADEIELPADPTAVADVLPAEPPPTLATAVHRRLAPRLWPTAARLALLVLALAAAALMLRS
jgi:serine/threonine-protein kinase